MVSSRKTTNSPFLLPLDDLLRVIEEWCKATGVTKYQLSRLLELDRAAVTRIFTGERRLLYDEAEQMSDYLMERLSPLPNEPVKLLCARPNRLVSVQLTDTVAQTASDLMRGKFTQLPVFNGDSYVGLTTDKMIIERMLRPNRAKFSGRWLDALKRMPLKQAEIIETSAIYPSDASVSSVANALRKFYAVMVAENEKPSSIITRWDFLKLLT